MVNRRETRGRHTRHIICHLVSSSRPSVIMSRSILKKGLSNVFCPIALRLVAASGMYLSRVNATPVPEPRPPLQNQANHG